MPFDPTIALQAKAPTLNPLQMAMQAAQYKYMNSNANALQQQIGANQAMSGIFQKNTDANGNVDYGGVVHDASQNPDAAYNLPQLIQGINTQKIQGVTLQTGEQGLANKRWQALGQVGMNYLSNPNANATDFVNGVTSLVQNGVIDAKTGMATLAHAAPSMNDPVKLRGIVQQTLAGLPPEVQAQLLPKLSTVNTGGQTNLVAQNPMTGAPTLAGTLNNTVTPDVASTPTPTFNNGVSGTIPRGQLPGNAPYVSGAPPLNAGATPAPLNGGHPANFNPTGPALGQDVIANAAAKRFSDLTDAAASAPIAINGYDRALAAVGGTSSGPGIDPVKTITGTLNALNIPVASDATTNYQSLKKYLANAATSAAAASGYSGSDARMDAFSSGQPDPTKMNPAALTDAIQYVKALQSGVIAKNTAAQSYLAANGGNTATLPKFETQWSQAFNPDVMEFKNLSTDPQAQAQFVKSLPAARQQAMMKSYQSMSSLGAFAGASHG